MTLYVHESGPQDAPAIVLLHGLGLGASMWQLQLEQLSDFHCLAPDLPEHGKSQDAGPFTLQNACQQVADLICARVLGARAHVVGLSMGGAVVLRLLHQIPEVVDHAIVSGSSTRLNSMLITLNKLNGPVIRMLSPDQLASLMLKQFNIPQRYRPILIEDMRAFKPEAFAHGNAELARIELPLQTKAPLLVMVGQKETFIAKGAASAITRSVPGAKGVIVPNVGHVWNLTHPKLFSDTVRAWVTDGPLPGALLPL